MMWILQKHLESFTRILRASKDCSAQGTSVNTHLAIAALLRHLVQRVKTCHWVFQMRIFDENLLPAIIVLWNMLDRNARTTFFKKLRHISIQMAGFCILEQQKRWVSIKIWLYLYALITLCVLQLTLCCTLYPHVCSATRCKGIPDLYWPHIIGNLFSLLQTN